MRLTWILLPVIALAFVASGLLLVSRMTSAVQDPTLAIDMNTGDNTYVDTTNTMTVNFTPATDFCLSTAANPAPHNHIAHIIVQNVEDLVGWQAVLTYTGDQYRPSASNFAPFMDNNTGQNISFNNLPLTAGGVHRDLSTASDIPPQAPGTQVAGIGSTILGDLDFPTSPDTPAKAVPDGGSYSAPTGGVLASVVFQVVGDQSGQYLSMNMSAANPPSVPIGSGVSIFNGTDSVPIQLPETALGDATHGEGVACQAATPTPAPTPVPTATPTPGPGGQTPTPGPGGQTPTGPGGATATPTRAAGTPTRTPTPRVTPAALPPTGGASPGLTSLAYVLLFGAGLVVAGSGTAFAIQRLRRDEPR
jgi:hypothetical protein